MDLLGPPTLSSRDRLQELHWLPVKWRITKNLPLFSSSLLDFISCAPSRFLNSTFANTLTVPRMQLDFSFPCYCTKHIHHSWFINLFTLKNDLLKHIFSRPPYIQQVPQMRPDFSTSAPYILSKISCSAVIAPYRLDIKYMQPHSSSILRAYSSVFNDQVSTHETLTSLATLLSSNVSSFRKLSD